MSIYTTFCQTAENDINPTHLDNIHMYIQRIASKYSKINRNTLYLEFR